MQAVVTIQLCYHTCRLSYSLYKGTGSASAARSRSALSFLQLAAGAAGNGTCAWHHAHDHVVCCGGKSWLATEATPASWERPEPEQRVADPFEDPLAVGAARELL